MGYAELARRIDEPENTVAAWMKGKHRAPMAAVLKIARALGLPLAWLVDEDVPYSTADVDLEQAQDFLATLTPEALEIIDALGDRQAVQLMLGVLRAYLDSPDRPR